MTCLKHLLLGKHPPHPCEHCSTICAEHSVKIQLVSSSKIQLMLGKWREVSPEQLLPSIGRFIHRNAKKHGVAIPNELKEYLEQLEVTTTTQVSKKQGSSLPVAAEGALSSQSSSAWVPVFNFPRRGNCFERDYRFSTYHTRKSDYRRRV